MRWLALAVAVASAGLAREARADDDCQLVRIATLDMASDGAGGVNVPMTIQGRAVNMLIDTGGIFTMLTRENVKALDLTKVAMPLDRMSIRGFGGRHDNYFAVAHDIVLGGLKAPTMDMVILDDGVLPPGVGGILGPDVLRAYDDDFDFANGKFSLFWQQHCPGKVVHWTNDPYAEIPIRIDDAGHIVVPVELDGREVNAIIDTGASRSIMSLERSRALFGLANHDPALEKTRFEQWEGAVRYPFKSLTLNGIAVAEPDIVLLPNDLSHFFNDGPPLILGMGILRQLHLYIAYKERKLYVTPASAH